MKNRGHYHTYLTLYPKTTLCLKITEKVAVYNGTSEASYIHVWLINFNDFFKNWSFRSNIVTKEVIFKDKNWFHKCQTWKFKWDILVDFEAMWWNNIFVLFSKTLLNLRICLRINHEFEIQFTILERQNMYFWRSKSLVSGVILHMYSNVFVLLRPCVG